MTQIEISSGFLLTRMCSGRLFITILFNLVWNYLLVKGGTTCCKDAWVPYHGSCYYFYEEVKVSWEDATMFCKTHDSELAIIETRNENLFLKAYARRLFREDSIVRNRTIFWLGATDQDIEGIWKWVSTDEELVFTDWDINEPDMSPDNTQDCLALNGGYDFNWRDGYCFKNVGSPICETKEVLPTGTTLIG